jgi:hypothetical protein
MQDKEIVSGGALSPLWLRRDKRKKLQRTTGREAMPPQRRGMQRRLENRLGRKG